MGDQPGGGITSRLVDVFYFMTLSIFCLAVMVLLRRERSGRGGPTSPLR